MKTSMNPLPTLNPTVTQTSLVSEENGKTKMKRKNIFEKTENIKPENIQHEIIKPEIVKYEKADESVKEVKQDASFEVHDYIDTDKYGICSLDHVDNIDSNKTDVLNPIIEDKSMKSIKVDNVSDANDNDSGMRDDINANDEDKDNEADLSRNDNNGRIKSPNFYDVNSDTSSIGLLVDHGHKTEATTLSLLTNVSLHPPTSDSTEEPTSTDIKSEEPYSGRPTQSSSSHSSLLPSSSLIVNETPLSLQIPISGDDPPPSARSPSSHIEHTILSHTSIPALSNIGSKEFSPSESGPISPSIADPSSFLPTFIDIKTEEPSRESIPPSIQISRRTLSRTDSNITNNIFDSICGKVTASSDPARDSLDPTLSESQLTPNAKEMLIIETCEKMNSETGKLYK
jgi:hypothetical protein